MYISIVARVGGLIQRKKIAPKKVYLYRSTCRRSETSDPPLPLGWLTREATHTLTHCCTGDSQVQGLPDARYDTGALQYHFFFFSAKVLLTFGGG